MKKLLLFSILVVVTNVTGGQETLPPRPDGANPGLPAQPIPPAKYGQTAAIGFRLGYDDSRRVIVIGLHEKGPAERAGVQLNDQLTAVDGTTYIDTRHFAQAIGKHTAGETVRLDLMRNGQLVKIDVVLDGWNDAFQGFRRMAPGYVAIDDGYGFYGQQPFLNDGGFWFTGPQIYATPDQVLTLQREIQQLRAQVDELNRRLQEQERQR